MVVRRKYFYPVAFADLFVNSSISRAYARKKRSAVSIFKNLDNHLRHPGKSVSVYASDLSGIYCLKEQEQNENILQKLLKRKLKTLSGIRILLDEGWFLIALVKARFTLMAWTIRFLKNQDPHHENP